MARIHVTLKLSHVRRGLIAEQQHQVEIKQLLFAFSYKIRSGFRILASRNKNGFIMRIFINSAGIFEQENNIDCKVMAASLPFN